MTYSRQDWVDGLTTTPISAERLNHMEEGIEAAHDGAAIAGDHGALGGLLDDDHPQYALADGSRGDFPVGGDLSGMTSNAQIVANAVDTTEIADDAVTYAKMQETSAADVLLGSGNAGPGDVQEITLGAGLAMTGTTLDVSEDAADGGFPFYSFIGIGT